MDNNLDGQFTDASSAPARHLGMIKRLELSEEGVSGLDDGVSRGLQDTADENCNFVPIGISEVTVELRLMGPRIVQLLTGNDVRQTLSTVDQAVVGVRVESQAIGTRLNKFFHGVRGEPTLALAVSKLVVTRRTEPLRPSQGGRQPLTWL